MQIKKGECADMKRFAVVLLVLLLCAGLCLPVFAVPQNAMLHTATDAAKNAVGKDTPGAAVAVFEGGARTLFEGYGYADITARTLVTAQTSFELGELSAIFVVLAVQKLIEEGKAELDRDVAYYLPAAFTKELDLAHVITLRDLLTGGAGFAERKTDLRYTRASLCFDSLQEALLADVPDQINPPARYHVPNAFEIALAAFVVECIAGQSYTDFVTERFLTPLGMAHTVLDPRANTAIEAPATGHIATEEGVFATAEKKGRTYGALWPANGAISDLADLSLLLEFLLNDNVGAEVLSPASRDAVCALVAENGAFSVGAAGLAVGGTARGTLGVTPYFSAALAFDRASGKGAVVLCNVARSTLLSLPATLCGLSGGVPATPGGSLYDTEALEGEYVFAFEQRNTLIARRESNLRVTAEEDGTLLFGERRLKQVAPGLFEDAEAEGALATVQFTLTIEGEVSEIYTADGACYRPAGFFETDFVQGLLFGLLIVGAIYFIAAGVLTLAQAIRTRARGERHPRAWRFTIPWVIAALHGLLSLSQVFVGASANGGAVASFFTASSVLALCCTIGAAVGFALALLTSFTKRGMGTRVILVSVIYMAFLFLNAYFGVILL